LICTRALLGVAVALLTVVASPALAEKRVALVVGNDDYRNVPKLQKAVNDARAMGDTLRKLGFEVMVAENQTRQGFAESLLAFDNTVEQGDTAFFFFAGHGFEIAGQNYLLPTDIPAATAGQEELVRDSSILADRVIERLQNRGARTAILVFDASATIRSNAKGPVRWPAAADWRRWLRSLKGRSRSSRQDRSKPHSTGSPTPTPTRTRCSHASSSRNWQSRVPTSCKSRNARDGPSARWPRP
jgi:hypothetical protein